MRTGTIARAIAVSGAVLLAVTACGGSDDNSGSSGSGDSSEKQVNIYGTDGNMGNALGEEFNDQGSLAGMKGTTPLTDLCADFKDRLKTVDPDLAGLTTTPASPTTRSCSSPWPRRRPAPTTPTCSRPTSTALTFGGDKCTDYAACLEILKAGGERRLRRRSPARWASPTPASPPRPASVCCSSARTTRSTTAKTEFVVAGDEANAATDAGPARSRPPPPAARWSSARCCR